MVGVDGIDCSAFRVTSWAVAGVFIAFFAIIFILNDGYSAQVDEDVAFGDLAILDFRINHAAVPQVVCGLAV